MCIVHPIRCVLLKLTRGLTKPYKISFGIIKKETRDSIELNVTCVVFPKIRVVSESLKPKLSNMPKLYPRYALPRIEKEKGKNIGSQSTLKMQGFISKLETPRIYQRIHLGYAYALLETNH